MKCSFRQPIDFLEISEHSISFGSKCLPDIMLGSPPIDIATEPFFFLAYVSFLWLCSMDSTTPNFNCLSPFNYHKYRFTSFYLYMQIGVPIFRTPYSTSTPRTIGSLFLKVATCFRTHGKTAYFPYFYFLANFTAATCLEKKSVKW